MPLHLAAGVSHPAEELHGAVGDEGRTVHAGLLGVDGVEDGNLATLGEPVDVRARDIRATLQVLARFGDAVTLRTRYDDVDVQMLSPDLAAVGASFETTVEGMDAPFGFSGVTTMLVERRDGAWKIRHGHTSSARPGGR